MQKQSYYPKDKLDRISLIGDSDLTKIANEFFFKIEDVTTNDFSGVVAITSSTSLVNLARKSSTKATSSTTTSSINLTKLKSVLRGVTYTTSSSSLNSALRGSTKSLTSLNSSSVYRTSLKAMSVIGSTSNSQSLTLTNSKGTQKPLSSTQSTLVSIDVSKLIQRAIQLNQSNSMGVLPKRGGVGQASTSLTSYVNILSNKAIRLNTTLPQLSNVSTNGEKTSTKLITIQSNDNITMTYDVYVELISILKEVELFVTSNQSMISHKGASQANSTTITSSIQSEQITNRLKSILLSNGIITQSNASKAIVGGELSTLVDTIISLYYTKYIPKGTLKIHTNSITLPKNKVGGVTLTSLAPKSATTQTTLITQSVTLNEEVFTHDFRIHR